MGDSTVAGRFYADLHIHSKYSRACSKDCDLENLSWYARRKGIGLVGTGDFTHPAWYAHLRENLVEAEPGLYVLRADVASGVNQRLPRILRGQTRFMLSVEISTIYKRGDKTRKVHHLIYLPDLDAVARFNTALGRIGNLGSDGRPIIGLDSRDLLEIVLQASPDGYLVPAHIWTPWFSALGSKSGFDAIADCYLDLADYIFAVETGLSSDPEMNSRVSSLDRYTMMSNSDAHSPPMLGREATAFSTPFDYFAIRDALRTRSGYEGTLEFFPEEGKYHADGHRNCDVVLSPSETIKLGGKCPVCGKPVTVGVLSRIEALADRPATPSPAATSIIPLPEILGELNGVGPKTKTVATKIDALVNELGPEFEILTGTPIEDVAKVGGELLGEAIDRLRRGDVRRESGYDGEYGAIRLFDPAELRAEATLFDGLFEKVPAPKKPKKPKVVVEPEFDYDLEPRPEPRDLPAPSPHEPMEPVLLGMEEVGTGLLDRLDAMQRVAASASSGAMLIVAGPGTGKTRTLTHRIAYLVAELGVAPSSCLAITFTRRAAGELAERLHALLPDRAAELDVGTFHSLGMGILREHHDRFGLPADFQVTSEEDVPDGFVSMDDLINLPVQLLSADPVLADRYQARWPWIFVDEYQDVDEAQYKLLTLLCPPDGNLYAIGDPDQAIYAFRGADVKYFLRFAEDFPQARTVRLTRNYRSAAPILAAAVQAIAPGSLVQGRILEPARRDPDPTLVGLYSASSEADEADHVVRTIEELVGGSSHHAIDSGRASGNTTLEVGFADIAVLYRTDAQAKPLLAALERAGIPVQKRSHNRLTDRAGVRAIARELPFLTGTVAARIRAAAAGLTSGTLAGAGLEAADVHTAVELLAPLARRCGDDLDQLLTELRTGAEVDALDPRADQVTLLTLHAAKGLEFPVVFMVGCENGLLPLRFPGQESDEAEERRLFFVGLTRAQDRLYLSHAARRFRHGAERELPPSPFLSAIDASLLARRGAGVSRRKPRDQQLRLL
ncbi:uncharacterized protein (TIGR00375 family) [Longispora fulva]|uniref:DNA 3'-5' helicase n=1 Tax=Longispora fulva TaxID=619741 RepID=A0A8J7KLR8_9ACTN|nr:UvrD-helicase domain-containing protein [Longispora fulva]MBG6139684.1 uncharacterized protein (TIGR00375 family) [Longispora fulva]